MTALAETIISLLIILIFVLMGGCGSEDTATRINYVNGSRCEALTSELVEYSIARSEDYFGERVETDVYVNDAQVLLDNGCGGACAKGRGIAVACGPPSDLVWKIVHELGHVQSARRFNDWDPSHQRFKVYYNQWVGWVSSANVMGEHGL